MAAFASTFRDLAPTGNGSILPELAPTAEIRLYVPRMAALADNVKDHAPAVEVCFPPLLLKNKVLQRKIESVLGG